MSQEEENTDEEELVDDPHFVPVADISPETFAAFESGVMTMDQMAELLEKTGNKAGAANVRQQAADQNKSFFQSMMDWMRRKFS